MEKDKKPHFKPRRRHAEAEGVGGGAKGGYSCSEARERKKKNNNK